VGALARGHMHRQAPAPVAEGLLLQIHHTTYRCIAGSLGDTSTSGFSSGGIHASTTPAASKATSLSAAQAATRASSRGNRYDVEEVGLVGIYRNAGDRRGLKVPSPACYLLSRCTRSSCCRRSAGPSGSAELCSVPLRLDSSVPPRSHRRANSDAAGKSSGSVGTIGRRTAARLCRSALCRHRVKLTPWLPRLDTVSGVSLYERLSRPALAGPHAAATQITRAAETVDPEREELGALDYTRTTITATKETIDNDREPLATHDLDSIRRRLTARTVETRAPETVDPDRQLAAAALQDRR
jgi:hypothetical protein